MQFRWMLNIFLAIIISDSSNTHFMLREANYLNYLNPTTPFDMLRLCLVLILVFNVKIVYIKNCKNL